MKHLYFKRESRGLRALRIGPLYVMWGLHPGGWFRLFGYGLSLSNHDHEPPLFSERYGYGNRRYFHLGPWCLHALRRNT